MDIEKINDVYHQIADKYQMVENWKYYRDTLVSFNEELDLGPAIRRAAQIQIFELNERIDSTLEELQTITH